MKNELIDGSVYNIGNILKESHESLKSMYQTSCEQIDFIIDLSETIAGWYGGRIIGGGFGGCSIHLIADNILETYKTCIEKKYMEKYNIIPDILKVRFSKGL